MTSGVPEIFQANPVVFALAALVVVFVLARIVSSKGRQQDSRRAYTKDERVMGFSRAGGRCEMDGVLWFRCRQDAAHGDHYLPWSKGGATSMQNFVAACAHHNTSKGAKMPTFFQTKRIVNRRRSYFPQGLPPKPGEWFGKD